VVPVKSYSNADTMKLEIFQENKNKAGIYRWVNHKNGKSYIGSSVNLTRRFYQYLNSKYLLSRKMIICQALLKYGYSAFSLEILEYCDKKDLIFREQFYFDFFKPEININPIAGNSLGFKHSLESINKMSLAKKGEKHPQFGLTGENSTFFGRTHSTETREKISKALLGKNYLVGTREKMSIAKGGSIIYLYSLDFQLLSTFISSRLAARNTQRVF
jgi:group I intron endonuclease